MFGRTSRQAWFVGVRIDRDRADVRNSPARQKSHACGHGVVVGVSRNWGHVFIRAAAFVVAQEKDRISPGFAIHELVENVCDLRLTRKYRLAGSRMLVAVAIGGFDVREAG